MKARAITLLLVRSLDPGLLGGTTRGHRVREAQLSVRRSRCVFACQKKTEREPPPPPPTDHGATGLLESPECFDTKPVSTTSCFADAYAACATKLRFAFFQGHRTTHKPTNSATPAMVFVHSRNGTARQECRTHDGAPSMRKAQDSHRSGLAGDFGVVVRLPSISVDDEEIAAGRVGVLRGEAARQHGAGLHVEDELGAIAAVLVGEEAGEVGVGGARDTHAAVEADRAARVISGRR